MSNNGTGFWVIVALIAAVSFVVLAEFAFGLARTLITRTAVGVRRRVNRPRTALRGS